MIVKAKNVKLFIHMSLAHYFTTENIDIQFLLKAEAYPMRSYRKCSYAHVYKISQMKELCFVYNYDGVIQSQ